MSPTIETIVSADIGGTNSRLELHEVNRTVVEATAGTSKKGWIKGTRAPGTLVLKKTYQNHEFKSFEAVLHAFLREANAKAPVTACFAVAGPVRNNAAQLTNRNWNINGDSIAQEFSIRRVLLVNDFVALGYGLLTLDEAKECVCLQDAPKQPDAPIACIGAGTGLGQCFLTPVPGEDDLFADAAQGGEGGATVGYTCFPSEGGHAEFAPRNDLEFDLLNFLMRKFEQKHRVSVERVVSGTGLVNVYEYFCSVMPDKVSAPLQSEVEAAGDMKGAVIAAHAQKGDEVCKKVMEVFATAYGAEAGVAALKWLPFGGLYLTGGLTPKNIDLIMDPDGPFMTALFDKGRVKSLLYSVPIYAVLAEDVGKRGAHYKAYQEYKEEVLAQTKKKKSWFGSSNHKPAGSSGGAAGGLDDNDSLSFSLVTVVVLVATAYVLGQLRGRMSH